MAKLIADDLEAPDASDHEAHSLCTDTHCLHIERLAQLRQLYNSFTRREC